MNKASELLVNKPMLQCQSGERIVGWDFNSHVHECFICIKHSEC